MPGLLIGYARVSTEEQDLTAQRDGLQRLGVEPSRIYVDGTKRTPKSGGQPRGQPADSPVPEMVRQSRCMG